MNTINIRKILVPIDFSNNSMNALQTAAAIAKRHTARIHLLHINDADYDLFGNDNNIQPPHVTDYTKTLAQLAKSVINTDDVRCSYSAEVGGVTNRILHASIQLDIDLIVMGKSGTNGNLIEFAGSHACQVAEKSRIPVMIVPEGITKYSFENILFPVRPLLSVTDKYDAMRPFLLMNNPSITLLNLRNPDYENELHIIHRLGILMKSKLEEDKVPYKMEYYFKDDKFAEHVLNVMRDSERSFDLAVISIELDKMNKDFHMGYYGHKIIHNCQVPLLVIHPDAAKMEKDELLNKLEADVQLN